MMRKVREMGHTLESMVVMTALTTVSFTLPQYFTYATSVSGWFDMYMHRNLDFSATGSLAVDMVATVVGRGDLSGEERS